MRVLDVDLDFFQEKIAYGRSDDRPKDLRPWAVSAVDRYFRQSIGLNKALPGECLIHHSEVFYKVKSLALEKSDDLHLDWVHVDAHSDLGSSHIGIRPEFVEDSDFLLHIGISGWISSLHIVLHDRSRELDQLHMRKSELESTFSKVKITTASQYRNSDAFDYFFLSYSPEYTSGQIDMVYDHIRLNFLTSSST